jgi:hypothetical protein
MVDEAKDVLQKRYFHSDSREVYYGRQLEIWLEREFFHWITKKALNELVAEKRIDFSEESVGRFSAHFYWPLRHRYPRRQINRIVSIIQRFSNPNFTSAVGSYGEILADAGFARIGFRVLGDNIREVDGRQWTETNHNLDRLVERDDIRYGVEIKNELSYIDMEELELKVRMSEYFYIRPMFIARMMPKSYIYNVQKAGGFCLILERQFYPPFTEKFAEEVRGALNLPVYCVRKWADTTMKRFESWHERQVV